MPKYKHGKQTHPITFEEFKQNMEHTTFKKKSYPSFIAFLFWFGVRLNEALRLVKEDFKIEDGILIVDCEPEKHGMREPLEIYVELPFVELIVERIKRARHQKRIWRFSERTARRIVKQVMGEKYYPHFFRLNRAVAFLDDPETTLPEMLAWFGWRSHFTVDHYLGYSRRHVRKQRDRLKRQMQETVPRT